MQPSFWHERWRNGQIGFHQAAVDRQLARHWAEMDVSDGAVFVPLCGKSLDLIWLRNQGLQVTGAEISAVALESLCLEQGLLARRAPGELFDRYESPGLRLLRGDLFELTREMLGAVNTIYDRASLIAFPPDARPRYVAHLTHLTAPQTKTLLITVEYPQAQMSGPPFSVSAAEVDELYRRHHSIQLLERRDSLSDEARLRSRGITEFHENCFLLIRR